MKWAPFPDNDPDAARALMTRFYRLLRASEDAALDPVRAATLEVEWWRAHREHQHGAGPAARQALVAALRDLYAYTYGADARPSSAAAAELRAEAMDVSDAGSPPAATPTTRASPRSARCSCAPTPRCSPRCTAERPRARARRRCAPCG